MEEKLRALHAILNGDVSEENLNQLNDDWDMEEKIQAAFSFWNIQHLSLSQAMKSLSGGEKTKVFLSGISINSPEIILLDEPSNHLDSESRTILYDFIRKSKSTILVVSHDRTLLNLLDTTLELTENSIAVYSGNYDFYKKQKEEKLFALQSQLEEKEKMLKQTQQKARELAEQRQRNELRGKKQQKKEGTPKIMINKMNNLILSQPFPVEKRPGYQNINKDTQQTQSGTYDIERFKRPYS